MAKTSVPGVIMALALVFISLSSLASRIIEYPWIKFASKSAFDISRVELTDTAATLHFVTRGFPTTALLLPSDPIVKANGETFRVKSANGIKLGEESIFPSNGVMEFSITFEPMPESTQNFDFIAGSSLWLKEVNLTEITESGYSKDIPMEIQTYSADTPVPEPSFTIGETVLNFHLRPYLPAFSNGFFLFIDYLDGRQENYSLNFDNEGNTSVKFMQYGTCTAGVADMTRGGVGYAQITVLPGETADCWLDSRISGACAMSYRDGALSKYSRSMHTGYYGDFDRMRERTYGYSISPYTEFADYRMTGDEYLEYVKNQYTTYSDSISNSNFKPMEKEYLTIQLQNEVLSAIADYRDILSFQYLLAKNDPVCDVPADSVPARLSAEDYKEVVGWFDVSNPKLLMDPIFGKAICKFDWNSYGAPGDLSKSLNMTRRMMKKANEDKLKQEDVDSLRELSNLFFKTVADSVYSIMAHEFQLVKNNSKIFDSIVSPHRGKVVVVDLWNTWCGPCKRALKLNEPLKDGELNDEDIVWIYIADESSDPDEYERWKDDIRGIHYKLDKYQMESICNRFKVEGIPYYIIVDRNGNEEGRPDLRDHNLYITEIKEKLKQ